MKGGVMSFVFIFLFSLFIHYKGKFSSLFYDIIMIKLANNHLTSKKRTNLIINFKIDHIITGND